MIKVSVHILALGFPFSQALSSPPPPLRSNVFDFLNEMTPFRLVADAVITTADQMIQIPPKDKNIVFIYIKAKILQSKTEAPTDRPTRQTSGKMCT